VYGGLGDAIHVDQTDGIAGVHLEPRGQTCRVQPFATKVTIGSYWLTSLKSKAETDAMQAFRLWIVAAAQVQKS